MFADWSAFLFLVALYLAFAWPLFVGRLRRFASTRARGLILALLLLFPYLLLTLPSAGNDLGTFLLGHLRMAIYVIVPPLACLFRPAGARSLHPLDIVAILALWFPIEFGWLPDLDANLASGVNLPIPLLTAIPLGFLSFQVLRPLEGVGFTFRLTRPDWRRISTGLTLYTATGVPLGLVTGFLVFGLAPLNLGEWLASWTLGYLFTALPEELLFRGIIQNQLQDRIRKGWLALIVASIIFGLAHLNNATAGFPEPNWMYALMATLAGLAYGWTWRATGKISASAVVHATVNFVWGVLLSAG